MKKRSIAFLTSLIMIFSLLPMPLASAVEGLNPSAEKMKFTLEYMDYTDEVKTEFTDDPDEEEYDSIDEVGNVGDWRTSGIITTKTKPEQSSIKVGDEFLVGVKLENMDNVVEATDGMNNLCATILFNTDYIEAMDTIASLTEANQNRLGPRSGSIFTTRTTNMVYNVSYSFNTASGDIRDDGVINLPLISSDSSLKSTYNGTKDEYIAILKFKIKAIPTDATKVIYFPDITDLNAISRFTVSFGSNGESGSYGATADDANIQAIMAFDDSAVNLFSEATKILQSIAVTGSYTLPTQYVGSALNTTGLGLTATYTDTSTAAVTMSDVTYMVASTSGITDAASTDLSAVPASLTANENDKYLYAVVSGKIVEIGQLDVQAVAVNAVTGVNNAPTGVYAGQTVDFDGLTADVTYNNGTNSGSPIPYADFASNGLALYKVTDNDGTKTYTKVTSTNTYTLGNNVYVVGKDVASGTPDFMSSEFTVAASYDDRNLTTSENSDPKVKYEVGSNFDPSGIKVNVQKDSESSPTEVSYIGFATEGLKVVIAADAEAAKTADEATSSTKITESMLGQKIYVVVDNNGTKEVLEVGTIAKRSVDTAQVSGITADAKTYGDKLGDSITLTVTYDNGDPGETLSYDDIVAAGIKIKINGTEVTKDTVLTPEMSGKKVEFYEGSTLIAESVALTVNKKEITYTATAASAITKEYNGNTDVSGITVSVDTSSMVGTDATDMGTLTITGLTLAYEDKNAGENKTIEVSGTAAVDNTAFNAKYTLKEGTGFASATALTIKGKITKKALTSITVNNVPSIKVASSTLTGTNTLTLTTSNGGIIDGDKVVLNYTYTYASAAEKNDAASVTVAKAATDPITGDDAGNYSIGDVVNSSATGRVTDRVVKSAVISGITADAKTYGDTLGDGISITVTYDDNTSETINYADFATKGVTMKIGETTVAGDTVLTPADSSAVEFWMDGNKIATSDSFKVAKKEITYSAPSTDAPTKPYDGNTTVTSTIEVNVDTDSMVGTDAAEMGTLEITGLTFTYDNKNVGTDKTISVTGTAAVDNAAFNAKYTLKAGNGFENNGTTIYAKGEITAKTLNVTAITGVPSIVQKAEKLYGTSTLDLTKDNSSLVDGDVVTLNYKYTYSSSATVGEPEDVVISETSITGTDADNYTLGTVVSPVKGKVEARVIDTVTPQGITTAAKTYGDTLGDAISVIITYTNSDPETVSYNDFATNGIVMKMGDTVVDKDTVLTPDMTGKKIDFYFNDVKTAESVELTVNKKQVDYVVTTDAPTKPYDGNTDVTTSLPVSIDTDDLLTADSAMSALTVGGLTFSYDNKNVGTNKTITVSGTVAVAGDAKADFDSKYELVPGTGFASATELSAKGEITVKTLNVTAITGVPTIEVGAETLTGTATLALDTTNSDIVSGDAVTLAYTYTYPTAEPAGKINVGITTDPGTALSGTAAANYTLGTVVQTAEGEITNEKLASILVIAPTKVTYTYPDTKLDLTGMKINLNYEGSSAPTEMEVADFIADGGIISLTDATGASVAITADNITGVVDLPYGETTMAIAYGGKDATQKVTVEKKKISLADIVFGASKVFGSEDVSGTYSFKDGDVEAGDVVTVDATYTFTDEAAGENKEVKVTGITLTGDNADNYVVVDENGAPITAETTVTTTGTISQGEQVAPAKPTVNVDPKTNNIIVTGPLGDNIEYSIDGGTTWQKDPVFTGLTKGTEYTVTARVEETEDGNFAPSAPSEGAVVKTLKNRVRVFSKGADITTATPVSEAYTDETSAESDSDVNTKILPSKPTKFKAYYTDSTCSTKVVYPLAITADTVLYMTKTSSSGGGGGGGSSVTITLDKTEVEGTVGDSQKVTATVTGTALTPKWTSSDEKVATVDENGNITFIGEGTANIKINVSGTTKTVKVTVAAAEATPTPAPVETEKPVDDTPIIDVNYSKPYASGYEDGAFRPENNITRAELAAMIARLSYGDDLPDGMYDSSFPDVADDAWYNKYIAFLEDKNVLSGYEDGTFRPTNTITRGEISAVIARAQRYEILPYSGMFSDVIDYDWAKDYIETLATKNIVTGYEDGTFGPYSPLTRAEAVAIINRVLAPSTAIVTFTPNDIAGHWAEADIILAVNERQVNGVEAAPEATETPEETTAPEEAVVPEGEEATEVSEETADPAEAEATEATEETPEA